MPYETGRVRWVPGAMVHACVAMNVFWVGCTRAYQPRQATTRKTVPKGRRTVKRIVRRPRQVSYLDHALRDRQGPPGAGCHGPRLRGHERLLGRLYASVSTSSGNHAENRPEGPADGQRDRPKTTAGLVSRFGLQGMLGVCHTTITILHCSRAVARSPASSPLGRQIL